MILLNVAWKSLVVRKGVREALDSFVKQHGGEELFLEHLWGSYRAWLTGKIPRASRGEQKRWARIRKLADALERDLRAIEFENLHPEDILPYQRVLDAPASVGALKKLAEANSGANRVGHPSGRDHRAFWCAALLPYFELNARKADKWTWLIKWLAQIETGSRVPDAASLHRWWRREVLPPMTKYARGASITERGRKVLSRQGVVGLRAGHPPLWAAFEFLRWKRCQVRCSRSAMAKDPETDKYLRIIETRMPFFKDLGWT